MSAVAPVAGAERAGLLEAIAADAPAHDRAAAFPESSLARLEAAGLAASTVPGADGTRPDYAFELDLAREVARADLGLGRIFDGHLNGVERLAVQAPPELAEAELAEVAAGRLRLGVWGADPGPGEGDPAQLDTLRDGARLHGTKVFCSGAGGIQRAWVLVRGPEDPGPVRLAYVDLTADCEIDAGWWRGAGMRGSASHRVTFHGARVLAVVGGPGALLLQPWFARDAVRTAATWAGGLEAAVEDALAILAAKPGSGDIEQLAAAQLRTHALTARRWLEHAGVALDVAEPVDPAGEALHLRDALSHEVRSGLDEAARAVGSRAYATGSVLERVTRDLTTYTKQESATTKTLALKQRLEPMLARAGRVLLDERA